MIWGYHYFWKHPVGGFSPTQLEKYALTSKCLQSSSPRFRGWNSCQKCLKFHHHLAKQHLRLLMSHQYKKICKKKTKMASPEQRWTQTLGWHSIEYWCVKRDPYNGFLSPLYITGWYNPPIIQQITKILLTVKIGTTAKRRFEPNLETIVFSGCRFLGGGSAKKPTFGWLEIKLFPRGNTSWIASYVRFFSEFLC